MCSPAAVTVLGVAVFSSASAGDWLTPTDAVDGSDRVAAPSGPTPFAVAVLTTRPLSRSAWVTRLLAVQVVDASGASEAARQVTAGAGPAGAVGTSSTASWPMVTLPELVTRNR